MNKSLARKLSQIQAPRKMLKSMMRQTKTFKQEKEMLEDALTSSRTSLKDREQIKRTLNNPQWERSNLEVDEKMAKKVDKYVGEKIKAAIKSGTLPKPKLDAQTKKFLIKSKTWH